MRNYSSYIVILTHKEESRTYNFRSKQYFFRIFPKHCYSLCFSSIFILFSFYALLVDCCVVTRTGKNRLLLLLLLLCLLLNNTPYQYSPLKMSHTKTPYLPPKKGTRTSSLLSKEYFSNT